MKLIRYRTIQGRVFTSTFGFLNERKRELRPFAARMTDEKKPMNCRLLLLFPMMSFTVAFTGSAIFGGMIVPRFFRNSSWMPSTGR